MPAPTLLRNWIDPLPTFIGDALADSGDPFAKRLSVFESSALFDMGWTREDELTGSWIIWSNSPIKDSKAFFRFDTGDPAVSDIASFTTVADVQGSCVIVRSYPSLSDAQNKTNVILTELLRFAEDDDFGNTVEFQPYMLIGDSRAFYFFPGVQTFNASTDPEFEGFTTGIFAWLQFVGEVPVFSGTPAGHTIIGAGVSTSGQTAPIQYDNVINGLNKKITGAIGGAASEDLHVIETKAGANLNLGQIQETTIQGPTLEIWSPVMLRGETTGQARAFLPGLMDSVFVPVTQMTEGTATRTITTPTGTRQGITVTTGQDIQRDLIAGELFFDTESDWDLYHGF